MRQKTFSFLTGLGVFATLALLPAAVAFADEAADGNAKANANDKAPPLDVIFEMNEPAPTGDGGESGLLFLEHVVDRETSIGSAQEKFSYAMGVGIARALAERNVSIDVEAMILGIRDQDSDRKPLLVIESEIVDAMKRPKNVAIADFWDTLFTDENREKMQDAEDMFLAKFATRVGVRRLADGILIRQLESGRGPLIRDGQFVNVRLRGRLMDGEVFISSPKDGAHIMMVGPELRPGFQSVLKTLRSGDRVAAVIPSKLAYDDMRNDKIPPYNPLIYDIEVLSVE